MFRTICLLSAVLLILPVAATRLAAQESLPDSAVLQGRYVFQAQWAVSYNGHRRQLMPTYPCRITSDSIVCYLPFTGRTFTTPTEFRFMAIDFVSKTFSYNAKKNRRGSWDITIDFKDVRDVRKLTISLSGKGWATLYIQSAGRDLMSYEGVVEALE